LEKDARHLFSEAILLPVAWERHRKSGGIVSGRGCGGFYVSLNSAK
jgi:hypothetical protein